MLYVAGWELRNQLSRAGWFFATVFFIFIYNPRSGSALYEKELDGIRNWPSVLKTHPPVLMKGNELARYPTANLRVCRLSTASFLARFSFSSRFFVSLNSIHVRSLESSYLFSISNFRRFHKQQLERLQVYILSFNANKRFPPFNINSTLYSIILNDAF